MSHNFYNKNSQQFFNDTFTVDMGAIYARFLKNLPEGCKILDMGCGSGRDAYYFHSKGFEVEAFDASHEMVRLASEATGLKINQSTFENYITNHPFDGIWACASLLHLPKMQHPKIFLKYYKTLNLGGKFYMSFKYGDGEYEKDGRHFSCYNELSFGHFLTEVLKNYDAEIWVSDDVRKERKSEKWLNVLLSKL
jgi:SAM-dependent methyltransferase